MPESAWAGMYPSNAKCSLSKDKDGRTSGYGSITDPFRENQLEIGMPETLIGNLMTFGNTITATDPINR